MPRLKLSDLRDFSTTVMLLHVRSGDVSGARRIARETADAALQIAAFAFHNYWPLPEAREGGDGEVDIAWTQGERSLTFTVTPEAVVVWVSRERGMVQNSGSLAFKGDQTIRDTAIVVNEWFEGESRGPLPQ